MSTEKSASKSTWTLGLASFASLMVTLDILVVATAAPQIRANLHASAGSLEWTLNAYNLAFAVLLMTGSAVGDRFGRRRMFATGIGIFTVASAACALAPTIEALVAFRALQGAGAALMAPLAIALVGATVAPEHRGRAFGIVTSVSGLATIGGPLIGGALTQAIGWEWIFWVNVPIGLIAIPLVLTRIDESFGPNSTVDIPGVVLVTLGMLGVVWALVRVADNGWGNVEVVGSLVAGLAVLAAFIVWEGRSPNPMLPLGLFSSRTFSAGNVVCFLLWAIIIGATFMIAQYLQNGLGYGPLAAGLRILPATAATLVLSPLSGSLVDRIGPRPVIFGGLAVTAIGFVWMAFEANPTNGYIAIVAPLVVYGVGTAMTTPAAISTVIGSVPMQSVGKASGTNGTVRQLGGVVGVAVLVLVFAGAGSYRSASEVNSGFVAAMGVCAGFAAVAALTSLLLVRRPVVPAPAPAAVAEPA